MSFRNQLQQASQEYVANQQRVLRSQDAARKTKLFESVINPIITNIPQKNELLEYARSTGKKTYTLWEKRENQFWHQDAISYIMEAVNKCLVQQYDSSIRLKYEDDSFGGWKDATNPRFFLSWS